MESLYILYALLVLCPVLGVPYTAWTKFDLNQKLSANPDIYLDVPALIAKYGYPFEIHHVTTDDGYILTLHRIPHGREPSNPANGNDVTPPSPVFMQHGLLSSSACWILAPREKAPAYIMADAGYDVWLGNARGNLYSRNHTHLNPDSKEFWQFSWDEMAEHDLPAVIDYVLNVTKHSQLYYIGHSMGTTIFFAGMSSHPEYNEKVKAMFGLGPVATTAHIRSPIRYLAPFTDDIHVLFNLLGEYEFLPHNPRYIKYTEYICTHFQFEEYMCLSALFFLTGFDAQQFNLTWLPVILSHGAEGTSTMTVVHFAQQVNSASFQHYDYGKEENLKRYHQNTPPPYYLNRVTAPVNLFWANNDWLADPTDVARLAKGLPNLVFNVKMPLPKFNHVDFIWGIDCDKLVFRKILKYMPFFEKD
ncbi:hypothetical protein SK128_020556 [Halocaridina rubra]|uniref:Lipase n=1 Tax=Halocaridina rubra TaxID=373956 RepID=A0AAN8X919_HALRR